MGEGDVAVLEWRVKTVERAGKDLSARVGGHDRDFEDVHIKLEVQAEQMEGLQDGLGVVRTELVSLRNAFYALTGSLIIASLALAGAMLAHAL